MVSIGGGEAAGHRVTIVHAEVPASYRLRIRVAAIRSNETFPDPVHRLGIRPNTDIALVGPVAGFVLKAIDHSSAPEQPRHQLSGLLAHT